MAAVHPARARVPILSDAALVGFRAKHQVAKRIACRFDVVCRRNHWHTVHIEFKRTLSTAAHVGDTEVLDVAHRLEPVDQRWRAGAHHVVLPHVLAKVTTQHVLLPLAGLCKGLLGMALTAARLEILWTVARAQSVNVVKFD